jgi:hypothetical protein
MGKRMHHMQHSRMCSRSYGSTKSAVAVLFSLKGLTWSQSKFSMKCTEWTSLFVSSPMHLKSLCWASLGNYTTSNAVSAHTTLQDSQLRQQNQFISAESLQLCHHKAPPTTGSEFQLAKINKRWLQWLGCCIFLHAHGENFMMFAEKKLGHVYLLKQGLDWSISQHCSWFAAWPGSWLQEFHYNIIAFCSDV